MYRRILSAALAAALLAPLSPAQEPIRIDVLEPAGRQGVVRNFPAAVGLVFPEGELATGAGGALTDDRGAAVPVETEATAWWDAEKTEIKWLRLSFRADGDRTYFFHPGVEGKQPAGEPVAKMRGEAVEVDTGRLKMTLDPKQWYGFKDILLDGKPIATAASGTFQLTMYLGKSSKACQPDGWRMILEEATPRRASVKATTRLFYNTGVDDDSQPAAQYDIRYVFFKGESFIRVYHTLTWMTLNPRIGAREVSFALRPAVGEGAAFKLGLSEYTDQAWTAPWDATTELMVHQDTGDHYAVTAGRKKLHEGKQLGGWAAVEDKNGRGVAVCLRYPWQTWPTAFSTEKGELRVQFWPREGMYMSFTPENLMPPEYFNHPIWKQRKWTNFDEHFVHERARFRWFTDTGQGAARTHEMTLHFYDRGSRRPETMNSLTHHPFVLRQDPESAMRVPFMGMKIMPRKADKYPVVELAAETLARMSYSRWLSCHEYGFWRFGFIRWGRPAYHDPASLYRWMDGLQYDQQLIPWLMFMRGGDRGFFEEAEAVSRWAMDVGVNHYNTRGLTPGFCSTAGGTPWPYVPFHMTKGTKIHYLQHYYHLTGYRRAKEVMGEVMKGTLTTAAKPREEVPRWYWRTGGRECYNSNVLLANMWQETHDPEVKKYCLEWRDLIRDREYSPELNVFRPPQVYMYNSILIQQYLWNDPKLRDIVVRNLTASLLAYETDGGCYDPQKGIGSAYAYDVTKDKRFALAGWGIARTLADLTPTSHLNEEIPPKYFLPGSSIYRHLLMPILVGATLGDRLGLDANQPPPFRDTFFTLDAEATPRKPPVGVIAVRPKKDGDLKVRFMMTGTRKPAKVTAAGPDGKTLAEVTIEPRKAKSVALEGEGYGVLERNRYYQATLTVPNAKAGAVYRLAAEGDGERVMLLALTDAQIVHRVAPGRLFSIQGIAGQYYVGAYAYMKSVEDTVTVWTRAPDRATYSLRDADTWELLYRSSDADPQEIKHKVGKGRNLALVTAGYGPWATRKITGVSPWMAASREAWFDAGE